MDSQFFDDDGSMDPFMYNWNMNGNFSHDPHPANAKMGSQFIYDDGSMGSFMYNMNVNGNFNYADDLPADSFDDIDHIILSEMQTPSRLQLQPQIYNSTITTPSSCPDLYASDSSGTTYAIPQTPGSASHQRNSRSASLQQAGSPRSIAMPSTDGSHNSPHTIPPFASPEVEVRDTCCLDGCQQPLVGHSTPAQPALQPPFQTPPPSRYRQQPQNMVDHSSMPYGGGYYQIPQPRVAARHLPEVPELPPGFVVNPNQYPPGPSMSLNTALLPSSTMSVKQLGSSSMGQQRGPKRPASDMLQQVCHEWRAPTNRFGGVLNLPSRMPRPTYHEFQGDPQKSSMPQASPGGAPPTQVQRAPTPNQVQSTFDGWPIMKVLGPNEKTFWQRCVASFPDLELVDTPLRELSCRTTQEVVRGQPQERSSGFMYEWQRLVQVLERRQRDADQVARANQPKKAPRAQKKPKAQTTKPPKPRADKPAADPANPPKKRGRPAKNQIAPAHPPPLPPRPAAVPVVAVNNFIIDPDRDVPVVNMPLVPSSAFSMGVAAAMGPTVDSTPVVSRAPTEGGVPERDLAHTMPPTAFNARIEDAVTKSDSTVNLLLEYNPESPSILDEDFRAYLAPTEPLFGDMGGYTWASPAGMEFSSTFDEANWL